MGNEVDEEGKAEEGEGEMGSLNFLYDYLCRLRGRGGGLRSRGSRGVIREGRARNTVA